MQLSQFVAALQADLASVAAIGDDRTADAARRLSGALEAALSLRLVDIFAAIAVDLSAQLPAGRVEVRLAGRDPELVYVEDESAGEAAAPAEDATARITLRLPEGLKGSVEAAAAREGVSVNTWLVRALARAVNPPTRRPGHRLTGFAKS
jgi:hypothetical protein